MAIEYLDPTTGDFHPHKVGEKVNEIIAWVNNHDLMTLPRFKSELLELFKDEDVRKAIGKANYEYGLAMVGDLSIPNIKNSEHELKRQQIKEAEKELEEAILRVLKFSIDKPYNYEHHQVRDEDRHKLKECFQKWKEQRK